MEHSEEIKAHVAELVALYRANAVTLLTQISEVFDAPVMRDEFFTGGMVAAIIRDCIEPLREGDRR